MMPLDAFGGASGAVGGGGGGDSSASGAVGGGGGGENLHLPGVLAKTGEIGGFWGLPWALILPLIARKICKFFAL